MPQHEEQPSGSQIPPLCSSPGSISEPSSSSRPGTLTKRSSTVRFSDDTVDRQSQMSGPRRSGDTDEITPIRRADSHAQRNYNTTEEGVNTDTASGKLPTSPTTTQKTPKQSWWKKVAEKYGSVSLENKGSVARDHLALERTFLAWLRTSLAFASIGVAVTQLFRLNTSIQTRTPSPTPPNLSSNSLPLSPLLGHGLPVEMVPLLQQLAYSGAQAVPTPALRNTLLDQLLLMPTASSFSNPVLSGLEFNEHAAARLRQVGKPLGATFIGISIIVLLVGFHRYFEAQYWIIRGKFPASRGSVALVGSIAGALIVASLIIVLVVAPVSYEKR